MVMVCKPATLILTLCPAVGASPVLQLLPTDQSPLVPIQQSSTTQPTGKRNVVLVGPTVGEKLANAGALVVPNDPVALV